MRCLFMAALLIPTAALAQETATGAFLFAYQPHAGARAEFEEGYRAHLDWHREHQDSLTWIGWTVLAGPRLGAFVDGVFGIRFASLDARVDPAGDAADLAANVTAHGRPVSRELARLRRDLGTASPLEEDAPTPLVEVTRYTVLPGRMSDVAAAFRALRQEARDHALLPYTVYELAAGTEPGFLLMTWRSRLGSFDDVAGDPARALRRHLRAAGVPEGPVQAVTSEVWRYRPDLTYLAEEE